MRNAIGETEDLDLESQESREVEASRMVWTDGDEGGRRLKWEDERSRRW